MKNRIVFENVVRFWIIIKLSGASVELASLIGEPSNVKIDQSIDDDFEKRKLITGDIWIRRVWKWYEPLWRL